MTFPYAELRQKLVHHLIALEAMDPAYAVWALDQARREPSGLYRDLLTDIKAEKARRLAVLAEAIAWGHREDVIRELAKSKTLALEPVKAKG